MSHFHSYLNSAVKIIGEYRGDEPLATSLKSFFAQHKKYGSRDRKLVSHLCYCFYRLGKAARHLPVEERVLIALFLCSDQLHPMISALKPEWPDPAGLSIEAKWESTGIGEPLATIFPWKEDIGESIVYESFCRSSLIQPDLYLRIRPGQHDAVKRKLETAAIDFTLIDDDCVAISNSTKIDAVVQLNKEAVVQDLNSQRVGGLMKGLTAETIWDCCAASGGKSIMAYDVIPGFIELTVSDIRQSILVNLKRRFNEAGIRDFQSMVLDLSKDNSRSQVEHNLFSLVIADVPCTGSGTWARTPEQLYYFDPKYIDVYATLQKKIVANAMMHVANGGHFLYITCSVFKKENEDIVEMIGEQTGMKLLRQQALKGYDLKADTLFAALFQKSS